MRGSMIAGVVLMVGLVGGLALIASMDLRPAVTKVEMTIPHDKLPH